MLCARLLCNAQTSTDHLNLLGASVTDSPHVVCPPVSRSITSGLAEFNAHTGQWMSDGLPATNKHTDDREAEQLRAAMHAAVDEAIELIVTQPRWTMHELRLIHHGDGRVDPSPLLRRRRRRPVT